MDEKTKGSNRKRIDIFLVFLVVFLPRLYYNMQMMPVRTISDEVATFSTAAYFAGLDWSSVISHASYYGGGFTILLTPLFWLTDNPVIIYRTALVFVAILQSLVAPISYHLMDKYFHVKSRAFLICASIACSFMVVTRSNIVYNEHMLILLVWLVAWLLCILYHCEDKKKKIAYSVLLMLCLTYALMVHIRSYALWIAVAITVIYYFFVSKKWLVSRITVLIGGTVGVILSNVFIEHIQSNIWLAGQGDSLTNSTINITTRADLSNPEVWKTWLDIVLGQIYTIGIYSGTILLAALIIFLPVIFRKLFSKKERLADANNFMIILPLTFMLCIATTIAGQSVSWLSQAFNASIGGDSYGFKAFTYIRYFGPYCGPVFMATLVYIYSHLKEIRKIAAGTCVLFVILQAYWIFSIVPYLDGVTSASEIFVEFVGGIQGRYNDIFMYVVPSCILVILLIAIMFLFDKKRSTIAVMFVGCFLIWEYGSGSVSYDISTSQRSSACGTSGYQMIKTLEESGKETPEQIYVIDERPWSSTRGHYTYYVYQFYLNRYTIIPDYPEEDCEEAIVFCNVNNDKELMNRGYTIYQLDENEFVYVLGDQDKALVEYAMEINS